jgi:preprotein translocase subunit YajC
MRKAIVLVIIVALIGFTGVVRAATFYVDPARGKAGGNGSAKRPWRTLQEVVTRGTLRKVKPGDVIFLRSGYHGDVTLSGDNKAVITIAAAKGHKPALSRLTISSGSRWRIRGLSISPAFGDKPYDGNIVKFGDSGPSSDILIENCFIYTALDSSKWDTPTWKKANDGVFMGRHGKNLILRNNYILNTRFAVSLCAEDSLCEGNVITNFSADGIRVTRDGQTVRYNVIKNNYCSAADGDNNHDDGIQCFLFNKGTGTVRRVTVVGNIIINREDDRQKFHNPLQAIGFFDGPLVDFVVTDNVVLVDMWHGVSLYSARNCRIERNVAWSRWESNRRPWVRLGGKSQNCTVKNNYACSFRIDSAAVKSGNKPSNAAIYKQALEQAHTAIVKKFGKYHPVAGYARLGMTKGKSPRKSPAGDKPEKPAANPSDPSQQTP